MADKKYKEWVPSLPAAGAITGTELIAIIQDGISKQTTASSLVSSGSTLAAVLAAGNKTNELAITSNNGYSSLQVLNSGFANYFSDGTTNATFVMQSNTLTLQMTSGAVNSYIDFRTTYSKINTTLSLQIIAPSANFSYATASRVAGFDSSKNLIALSTATYPSLTELAYVKGVTSAIQTQLNTKITASSTDTLTNKSGNISMWTNDSGYLTSASLTGYVPYTGATADLDMGANAVVANKMKIKGTAGAGYLGLRFQSADPTPSANETGVFADASGNFAWHIDGNYKSVLSSSANTADRTYTFPDRNLTIDNITTATTTTGTGFVKGNGSNISFDNSTYLTGNQTITLSGDVTGSGATAITTSISNATVTGKLLTGYVSGAGVVAATDSILQAIQKLNGNIDALTTGVSSVNSATGAVTLSVTTNQGLSGTYSGTALTLSVGAITGATSFNGLIVTANTGVVTTGTWNGSVIGAAYGGTGIANNAASTITISGNFGTTFTVTGTTSVTLPTSGTLVNTAVTSLSSLTTTGTITTGGLGTGAVIGGVTMTLGSDASYDMYYRNASGVLTRLANGTTGQVLTATTSAAPSWAAAGSSGANTALSNLASVSINTALLFQTGTDIGSTANPARDLYVVGSGTYGTTYFKFTGTPTSTRTITIPDLTSTMALTGRDNNWAASQTFQLKVGINTTGTNLFIVGNNTSITYRTTNGGADITPQIDFSPSASPSNAGVLGYKWDTNNQFCYVAGNGTRQIARASIQIVNLTNTAGSEAGDLAIYTQTGGAAMALRVTYSSGSVTWIDAYNLVVGSTTGTKIGTATSQKLGFWNATPVVQPTTAVGTSTFVANTSGIVDDSATFGGYKISQIVKALQTIGILA